MCKILEELWQRNIMVYTTNNKFVIDRNKKT